MRHRDTIFIAAVPEKVWPFVADPARHAEWNAKVLSVGRARAGPVTTGERFEMNYRIGSRDRVSRVEVVRALPPSEVVFAHRAAGEDGRAVSEDRYTLAAEAGGTRLTQAVYVAGLPWWTELLLAVINLLGRPVSASPLATLKARVEAEE